MWKGYRSVVSLLVCLCFTLSALYLSTLHVNATEVSNLFDMLDTVVANYPPTYCNTYEFGANDKKYVQLLGGNDKTYQGTVTVPFVIPISTEKNSIDISKYYCVIVTPYTCIMKDFSYKQSPRVYNDIYRLNTSNYRITDSEGHDFKGGLITNYPNSNISETNIYRYYYFVQGSELLNGAGVDKLPNITVHGYYSFDFGVYNYEFTNVAESKGFSVTPQVSCEIYPVKTQFVKYIKSDVVEDVHGNEILNEQVEIQESIKDTQEDTNETTHSIFDSISSFFGSFFDNLLHIFVPEDGYFSNWFSRVNTLLNDKLGILYYPFNLLITFFQNLYDNMLGDQSHCYINFPEIAFTNTATNERYVFLNATTVDLAEYNIRFNNSYVTSVDSRLRDIVGVIRYISDVLLSLALLKLFQKNLDAIIRGSDNDS